LKWERPMINKQLVGDWMLVNYLDKAISPNIFLFRN